MGGWIWCKYCAHVYGNGKMIPVEIVPGMEGWAVKENDRGGDFKYDIFDKLKELL
jgi:hypothetical protein